MWSISSELQCLFHKKWNYGSITFSSSAEWSYISITIFFSIEWCSFSSQHSLAYPTLSYSSLAELHHYFICIHSYSHSYTFIQQWPSGCITFKWHINRLTEWDFSLNIVYISKTFCILCPLRILPKNTCRKERMGSKRPARAASPSDPGAVWWWFLHFHITRQEW